MISSCIVRTALLGMLLAACSTPEREAAPSDPPVSGRADLFRPIDPAAVRTAKHVRAVVAFVRFRDDRVPSSECETRAQREWSDLRRLPAIARHVLSRNGEPPFADSTLTEYFFRQSQGRFILSGSSFPRLIVTEREESAYTTGSLKVLDRRTLSEEVLRTMASDSDFRLSDFDANGDGRLDYLFIVLRRLNELQLVSGGAPAVAGLNLAMRGRGLEYPPEAGSYTIYGSSGIIIPHLDLIRLLAHEYGHDLWRASPLAGGHVPYIGGTHGVPSNGSRRLGYALMVGRLSTNPRQDVIDTRGDMLISAFERDILEDGWIDCPVLTEAGAATLGDLYATSDCRRLVLAGPTGQRTIYLTNRQRVGYFDRLQFNPCQSSYHGLMATGLLVQVREDRRLATVAADNSLELSTDTSTYRGDLFDIGTQLTPWTRPGSSGFTEYPTGFAMRESNWQAVDDIRLNGTTLLFEYVPDARERPIIRTDSWMGAETSGTRFRHDIVVKSGARLTITTGTTIYLVDGAEVVVEEGGELVVEPGAVVYR